LRDQRRLQAFELEMSALRAEEPLPSGRFGPAHYRAVHRHLFGDVYAWAGRYRTVRTAKGGNVFCYPEHIDAQMNALFRRLREAPFRGGRPAEEFVTSAASFLAELNAIHAFREGYGRAQLAFLRLVSLRAGHPIDFTKLRPRAFLDAMIMSFGDELEPLESELRRLV
jgi:cell filamentation protein